MSDQPMRIDVDKVLRERLSKRYRYIPRFVVRWLERTICQDRLNAILVKMAEKDNSVDAATAALDEMCITVEATGLERLPQGRFMFVSNHPLGGLDGLALISLLGNHYERHIKFIVNDQIEHLLMHLLGITLLYDNGYIHIRFRGLLASYIGAIQYHLINLIPVNPADALTHLA